MYDTDSRVGLVDMLSSCTRCTTGRYLEVFFAYLDIDILYLWHHGYSDSGCVYPSIFLSLGDTLDTMHS